MREKERVPTEPTTQQQPLMKRTKKGEDEEEERENGWSEIRLAVVEISLFKHGEKQLSIMTLLTFSKLLLQILDKIGPTMAVLRHDIQRNIQRLEEVYVSEPLLYSNLVEILKKEAREGTARKVDSCARAILWLTRSMNFSVELLERLEKDSESTLTQAVEEAYKNTLMPWHGWISAAAYKVAIKLIPERKAFMCLLVGKGQDYKVLKADLQSLTSLIQPLLKEIHGHLEEFRLNRLKST